MMDRRLFLKLTGLAAAASALDALPVAAQQTHDLVPSPRVGASHSLRLAMREPGMYRISGQVRLTDPLVEIRGITHPQTISWSGIEGAAGPLAGFTTFERFDASGVTPTIRVRGGTLESLTVVPVMDLE
jgi:hypothetical protein